MLVRVDDCLAAEEFKGMNFLEQQTGRKQFWCLMITPDGPDSAARKIFQEQEVIFDG